MSLLKGRVQNGFFQPILPIDWSYIETLNASPGNLFKFAGTTEHTTMGYYNATYGGVAFVSTAMTNKETGGGDAGSRVVQILGYPTGTVEIDKGALNVVMDRTASYPCTGWGGAPDTATRINVYQRAAHTTALGAIRGLYVYARQYSGGNCSNIYGAEISTDDRGSYGAGTPGYSVADMRSLIVTQRVNSVVPAAGTACVLHIQDNSQGSISANTCASNCMVKIESAQPIATGAKYSGIHFHTSGSGSGWTYSFSFQTAGGKEGFTAVSTKSHQGNVDGYITIRDVATGQSLYINCYDAVPN